MDEFMNGWMNEWIENGWMNEGWMDEGWMDA